MDWGIIKKKPIDDCNVENFAQTHIPAKCQAHRTLWSLIRLNNNPRELSSSFWLILGQLTGQRPINQLRFTFANLFKSRLLCYHSNEFFTTAAHRTSVEEELSGGEVTTRDSIGAQLLDKLFQLNIDPKKRDRITFKAFVWLLFKISFTYELLRERCIEKKVKQN